MNKKYLTVEKLIKFLEKYDPNLPIVLNNNPMGWVNGVLVEKDILYRKPEDKTNKFYMLFEDDHIERTKVSVLKLTGFYTLK